MIVPGFHRQVAAVRAESADRARSVAARYVRELEQRPVVGETADDDRAVVALERIALEARVDGEAADRSGSAISTCQPDPHVGQAHGGDGLVPKPEALRLAQARGPGQPHGSGDRVERLESLTDSPAVAAGLGLVRVGLDQVAVGLVALGLELIGEPAVAEGGHGRDDRDRRSRARTPPCWPAPARGCACTTASTAPSGETGRERIGRSSRNRSSSSRSSAAVAYRSSGSLAIALSTIVSRSRGIVGSTWRSGAGSSWVTWRIRACRSSASNAGRAGQQLVQGQPQRVDVGTGVAAALEPLGGHVADRAHDVAGAGQVAVAGDLGQAEVGDPDRAVGVEQEVRRLDVAVQDAVLVGVVEGLGDLKPDPRHASRVLRGRVGRGREAGLVRAA